ncbi:hypothetical protein, partial [Lyngbya sp. CCY1209]|uniref:hypothetical protein n=1 Tax=Lyngbya sp. CCY1209 TaxID=2886103 RepID=UPI002D2110D0
IDYAFKSSVLDGLRIPASLDRGEVKKIGKIGFCGNSTWIPTTFKHSETAQKDCWKILKFC